MSEQEHRGEGEAADREPPLRADLAPKILACCPLSWGHSSALCQEVSSSAAQRGDPNHGL